MTSAIGRETLDAQLVRALKTYAAGTGQKAKCSRVKTAVDVIAALLTDRYFLEVPQAGTVLAGVDLALQLVPILLKEPTDTAAIAATFAATRALVWGGNG